MKSAILITLVLLISACHAQNQEAAPASSEGTRRDHGVLPNVILQVPISFGETQTEIVLRDGEQPDDVAREFCEKHNIDVANSAQLVAELEKRLPPLVTSVPLTLQGGLVVNLRVYQGWNIKDTVKAFMAKHSLTEADGEAVYAEVQRNMPLVTLQVQGPDGQTIDPPLRLLNGQSPDVVSLEYCYTHDLDIPTYAHELNKALRSRVPDALREAYAPLRKVMLVIPFETADGIQRTPFYEDDVPASFSEKLCTQFNGGEGCYDRVLNYVNTQITTTNQKQTTAPEIEDTKVADEQGTKTEADTVQPEEPAGDVNEAPENKAAVEEEESAPAKEEIVPEQQTPVETQSDKATSTQEGTVHASVDDSNAASPLDEVRTLLRPTLDEVRKLLRPAWDPVYEAIGSPKSIPSDPLFLVVPVFAIIGLLLGLSSSSSGKTSKSPKASTSAATTKETDGTKTSKGTSSRKRSSTPSTKSKSKKN